MLRQEDGKLRDSSGVHSEFKAILGHLMRLLTKQNSKQNKTAFKLECDVFCNFARSNRIQV